LIAYDVFDVCFALMIRIDRYIFVAVDPLGRQVFHHFCSETVDVDIGAIIAFFDVTGSFDAFIGVVLNNCIMKVHV
jgi:hypothetical protein